MNFDKNCCDGIYNSIDIHFTRLCDNKCSFCIDKKYRGIDDEKPNVQALVNKIVEIKDNYDDVLFLGGEPCLFLDELIDCVKQLREKTKLKLFVTTSVPKVCYDNREKFEELIELLDGINLSVQHNNQEIADNIRGTKSLYDRNSFYNSLKHKEKIRINLNIVKPYLHTKEQLIECLSFFDNMGFNSIKLSEIQHGEEFFVSFEKVFGVNYGSPYYHGCQKYINMDEIIKGFKTPLLLKRSCFLCEETLKASFKDGVKTIYKTFIDNKPKNNYCVIYGNGQLAKGWI